MPKIKTKPQPKTLSVPPSLHRPMGLVDALPKPVGRVLHSRAIHILEIAFVAGAVVVWGAFAVLIYGSPATTLNPAPTANAGALDTTQIPKAAGPVQTVRHLDGVTVASNAGNAWPIGVMIENTPAARPQSGLSFAKVVIEAPAESGVTRFLALFDGSEAASAVGPVRSARHYFVSWALGWDAIYVHAGGSPQAYAFFQRVHTWEVEALGNMARYFYRDRARPAPHNYYTTMVNLRTIRQIKQLVDPVPTYTPWTYHDAPALDARGTPAGPITVGFAGASYRVTWTYDRPSNTYLRTVGGSPHVDTDTGNQIAATNVVVINVGPLSYLGEKGRIDFPTVGTGTATVFHDGTTTPATWSKASDRDMIRFLGADGKDVPLTPGNTWIEALVPGEAVTF